METSHRRFNRVVATRLSGDWALAEFFDEDEDEDMVHFDEEGEEHHHLVAILNRIRDLDGNVLGAGIDNRKKEGKSDCCERSTDPDRAPTVTSHRKGRRSGSFSERKRRESVLAVIQSDGRKLSSVSSRRDSCRTDEIPKTVAPRARSLRDSGFSTASRGSSGVIPMRKPSRDSRLRQGSETSMPLIAEHGEHAVDETFMCSPSANLKRSLPITAPEPQQYSVVLTAVSLIKQRALLNKRAKRTSTSSPTPRGTLSSKGSRHRRTRTSAQYASLPF